MILEDEKENPYLRKPQKLALITILVMIGRIALHASLWAVAGWSDHSRSSITLILTITWGIVVPVIIIILAKIGPSLIDQFEDADYIALIFGICYIVLAALTLFTMSLWIYPTILGLLANPEYGLFYLGLLACIVVALIMQIFILIAGVRNIQYYSNQLH